MTVMGSGGFCLGIALTLLLAMAVNAYGLTTFGKSQSNQPQGPPPPPGATVFYSVASASGHWPEHPQHSTLQYLTFTNTCIHAQLIAQQFGDHFQQ